MPSPTNSNSSRLSSDGSLTSPPVLMNGAIAQSPVPVKRPRYGYTNTGSVKGAGLKLRNQNGVQVKNTIGKRLPPGTSPTLSSNLSPVSSDGRTYLQILSQPEEQHRARYQTEGSRGAIKDRKCNGFPTVKLFGYDKPATLQIFIGTDQGKASPHMFYQACKVTGKSSTPCIEKKVEGTVMIEIEFDPTKDMTISCDCVGILKERNVDVEQRFPFHHASATQSRKKSTKCRMVFRTTVVNTQGLEETLQVSSLPILCTQPPGQPEICKQSMNECPAGGGKELFIIGKNFLKDTKVILQEENNHGDVLWEAKVTPHKDFLQQTHLICMIPGYRSENIATPVDCKIAVWSGGKTSEPHRFTYLPNISAGSPLRMVDNSPLAELQGSPSSMGVDSPLVASGTLSGSMSNSSGMSSHMSPTGSIASPLLSNHNVVCASPPDAALDMGSSMQMQPMAYETGMLPAPSSNFAAVEELKTLLEQTQDEVSQHPVADSVMSDGSQEAVSPTVIDLKPSPTFAGLAPECNVPMVFSESSNNFQTMSNAFEVEQLLPNLINQSSNQMNPIVAAAIGENSHHAILPIMANNNITDGATMNTVMPTLTPMTMTVTCEPLMKAEPARAGSQDGQPQIQQNGNGVFINGINGDFQGPIANALTQMSDNELINCINPSFFDQGAF